MKKRNFIGLPVLALILTGFFMFYACSIDDITVNGRDGDDNTPSSVDTGDLAAKIAEAESAKANVIVTASAANVARGLQFVTQADVDALESAIAAAKNVRDTATNQAAVTAAVTALTGAIDTFNKAFKDGAKENDFTAAELAALIVKAKAVKADVKPSANGDDVGPEDYWVSQSAIDALNAAITAAENIADKPSDNEYMALYNAINNFNQAKAKGTVPNKVPLNTAIGNANNAKAGVVQAASAAQAPSGSQWATPAQLAALDAAYNSALAVYNNANASQSAVTAATTSLNAAIQAFTAAVQANGPGQRSNSIKITGLNAYNGKHIGVGLFSALDEINGMNPAISGSGEGLIASGEVTVTLWLRDNNQPWTGTGSWYVGLIIETGEGEYYVSKSKVDFTANPNPAKTFNDFEKYIFSIRLGDLLGDEFFAGGQITLDQLLLLISDNEMDYSTAVQTGIIPTLYINKALTQPFTGADQVGANTIIYSSIPLDGGGSGGVPIPDLPAPTWLYVTVESSDSISLGCNLRGNSSGIKVYRSLSYSGPYSLVATAYAEWYDDTGLSPNTTYYYYVTAFDNNGNESPQSDIVSATTLSVGGIPIPDFPTTLTENQWTDGEITSSTPNGEDWYSFDVTYGTTYYIWWNDGGEGSGKSLDIRVRGGYSTGSFIFKDQNSGWNSAYSFTADTTGVFYVVVNPYSEGNTGTYAIAYSTTNSRP